MNNPTIIFAASLIIHSQLALLGTSFAQGLNEKEQLAIQTASEKIAASVLQVETIGGLEKIGDQLVESSNCTATVISEDGYLLSSAYHFAQKPSSILVNMPSGKRAAAKIVAQDRSRMLVLLKVNSEEKLTVPEFLDRKQLRVGQWAIAIGKTFSTEQPNLSVGVISAVNRVWGKAIQSDAKISANNYGGPLIDLYGRVLGILVPLSPQAQGALAGADWYDSGIGFAVPVDGLIQRLEQLKAGEDLKTGLLGISLKGKNIIADPAEIGAVRYNSPAQVAGIKTGDVIVSLNGQPVERQAQLKHALGPLYSDEKIKVSVKRGNKTLDLEVQLVDELIPYLKPEFGVLPMRDFTGEGILIRTILPDSPAANAGMQTNDIILQIGQQVVTNLEEARAEISQLDPEKPVSLKIKRGDDESDLELSGFDLIETIPDVLPSAYQKKAEAPAKAPITGELEIQLKEEANKSFAWIAKDYSPDRPAGVFLWLVKANQLKQKELINKWKTLCESNNLILLVVASANDKGWTRPETDVVRKCLDQLVDSYATDPFRTVVGGYESGGSMAYLVGFQHREIINGIVSIESTLPRGTALPDNDPLSSLRFFTATSIGQKETQQTAINDQLRKMKFPVNYLKLGEKPRMLSSAEITILGRWIDSLDRL